MSVAARLRLTFGVLLAVLGIVVAVHVVTMRRTVQGTRTLSAIAAREQGESLQRRRLDDMSASLRKYSVTGDREYLERLATLARAHDGQLRALEVQAMTDGEHRALRELALRWEPVAGAIDSLVIDGRLLDARVSAGTANRIAADIDALEAHTAGFGAASRFAMLDEIQRADHRAAVTQRLFWAVGVAAILLVGILATLLIRSIITPLEHLAGATRQVARGEFGARVLVRGRDELAILTRDFNDMSARLEQLDRMKRDFISNVSHDLKSPLAAIQETNEVLLDGLAGPLNDRQQRLIEISRDTGRRLASMIHKLLDLSRLDSRPTPIRELLDLFALTRRAVEHMNAARNARGMGPTVMFGQGSAHLLLRADAEEIAQLLDNLLENAAKFSPPGGVIGVELEDDDGVAVLRVSDEGPGVPDDEKHRIFERFYQADAGRTAPDHGVGLGLAICRHIAEAHGGTISVRDNAPAGAVFEVRIPGTIAVPASEASASPVELFV
jgi:two-component system sensor histidine kinase GlrK